MNIRWVYKLIRRVLTENRFWMILKNQADGWFLQMNIRPKPELIRCGLADKRF